MITKQELIDFEKDIAKIYETGVIRGPIHLRGGHEDKLIAIFEYIKENDYVFATWSNHLEALLKGIPSEKVKEKILAGDSMAMNFPEYKFYTSAIVGGICPIAVGTAWANKRKKRLDYVHAFIGDMTAFTGIASESIRYSINYDLPIRWIILDNNMSVCTDTIKTWKDKIYISYLNLSNIIHDKCLFTKIEYIQYKNIYPHSATGSFISF